MEHLVDIIFLPKDKIIKKIALVLASVLFLSYCIAADSESKCESACQKAYDSAMTTCNEIYTAAKKSCQDAYDAAVNEANTTKANSQKNCDNNYDAAIQTCNKAKKDADDLSKTIVNRDLTAAETLYRSDIYLCLGDPECQEKVQEKYEESLKEALDNYDKRLTKTQNDHNVCINNASIALSNGYVEAEIACSNAVSKAQTTLIVCNMAADDAKTKCGSSASAAYNSCIANCGG